jgi:hypothetical protein
MVYVTAESGKGAGSALAPPPRPKPQPGLAAAAISNKRTGIPILIPLVSLYSKSIKPNNSYQVSKILQLVPVP